MMYTFPLKKVHTYVVFSILVFLGVQSLKLFSIDSPDWIFYHLNDFLLIPIVALLGLHAAWLINKDTRIRLSFFTIFSLVVLFSVVFEYYLPKQSHQYTADVCDVIAYFLGGVVFLILQKLE